MENDPKIYYQASDVLGLDAVLTCLEARCLDVSTTSSSISGPLGTLQEVWQSGLGSPGHALCLWFITFSKPKMGVFAGGLGGD